MPKIVDHDLRRAELAEVAFRAFAEDGYAATSMRGLAVRAGVSTGALYHYFPDKSSILAHMFASVVEADVGEFDLPGTLALDAPQRIERLLSYVHRRSDHLRDVIRVALEVHRHEPSAGSREQVRASLSRYREAVAAVLGVPGGPAARIAFSFLVGGLVQDLLDPTGEGPGAQIDWIAALWQDVLRVTDGEGA